MFSSAQDTNSHRLRNLRKLDNFFTWSYFSNSNANLVSMLRCSTSQSSSWGRTWPTPRPVITRSRPLQPWLAVWTPTPLDMRPPWECSSTGKRLSKSSAPWSGTKLFKIWAQWSGTKSEWISHYLAFCLKVVVFVVRGDCCIRCLFLFHWFYLLSRISSIFETWCWSWCRNLSAGMCFRP